MNTLAEQLLACGLVNERSVREAEAARWLKDEAREKAYRANVTLDDLSDAKDRDEFRELARRVLLRDTSEATVRAVIQKAHRFKDEKDPSWPRWIAFFYQLRGALEACRTDGQRVQTVRQGFRRDR